MSNPSQIDWFSLMRGITEMHVKSIGLDVVATAGDYSSATKGQDADSGTGGGVTVISSPLYLLTSEIVDLVEQERKNR